MKNLLRSLAVVLATAAVASAGGGFAIYGTYANMDAFDDPGWGGGLKLQADIYERNLGFELRFQGLTAYGGDDPMAEDSNMASIEANITLGAPIGENAKVYVGGGAGYYIFPEYEAKEPIGMSLEPDIDPEDVWGGFVLAGVELMLNKSVGVFAEVKYLWAEVDKADIDDVEVDVEDGKLDGFSVNAGLLFRF